MAITHSDERWLLPDGTLVGASTPFVLNEIQYLNGVAGLSEAQKEELGIVKMAVRPDETFHVASPDLNKPGQWITTQRPMHEIIAIYQQAIEDYIEAVAKEKGYSSAVSCASYVSSTVPEWAAEAAAFVAWRDKVWGKVFELLAELQGEAREPLPVADVIAMLPAIEWPVK
jgi:hypothetical protein